MEAALKESMRTGEIEVINAGFAACNYPDTYYLYLKERGLDLDPDLIAVGLFVGNDIDHDFAHEHVWSRVDDAGLPLKVENRRCRVDNGYWVTRAPIRRYRLPVVRNSHLAQLFISAFKTAPRSRRQTRFNQWIYRRDYAERTESAVDRVTKLSSAMAALAEERGVPIVFVLLPAREQVRPDLYDFSKHAFMEGHELEKPQRILRERLGEAGLTSIDLLEAFRDQADDVLYFPKDQHWTPRGSEVAGRAIADSLLGRGLVWLGP
jgi:hypothetical protein